MFHPIVELAARCIRELGLWAAASFRDAVRGLRLRAH
jgi:hypothetical protein